MKKILFCVAAALLAVACTQQKQDKKINESESDFTQYVNPFIGTAFTGHTFPGATYPLGMIQAGPQTGNFSWAYCSGYFYEDSLIQGFTQNRLNGTGCADWCGRMARIHTHLLDNEVNFESDRVISVFIRLIP